MKKDVRHRDKVDNIPLAFATAHVLSYITLSQLCSVQTGLKISGSSIT